MRKSWLIAVAAVALAGCGKDEAAEQTTNRGQQVTAESIGGNDITAIDAATSSDANMAEDVEFNVEEFNALEAGNNSAAPAGNTAN